MAKHKYIESPEIMLELFDEYSNEVKSNPRHVNVFGGKDFDERKNYLERPLTMDGFEVFCFKKVGCVNQYFDNSDKRYDEYITICSHIKRLIRQDQIEGGMVGQYNPSITQRLNGLKDSSDATINVVEQPLFTKPKDV